MVKRLVKKLNPTSMMRIMELGFLICQQIPCRCNTYRKTSKHSPLRQRVLNIIGELKTPEHEACFINTLKLIIETKKVEILFDFVHSMLEYCNNGDQPEIVAYLSKQIFKTVIGIASNNRDKLNNNAHLGQMARQYVAYVRLFHPILFNQVLLTILLDGKKQRDEYDAEVAAQLSADDGKRLTRNNAHVKKASNPQKSPKFSRTPTRLLDDNAACKMIPRRGGAVSIATTTNISKNVNSVSTGVGRAMFRRITGIVGSKTEPDEDIKAESFKAKSFTCLNKLPNVFKKDEVGEMRSAPSHTQRRPATLGIPQLKSDLSGAVNAQREPSQPKIIVPIAKLREGVKIVRTLLELSPPGTVPDVKIIKEVLGMKAPILCRAVLIFELIRYIRKISQSWPRWMLELQMESEEGNQFKDFCKLKASAGNLFYGWAESLAGQLDEYGKIDSELTLNRHPKRHSVSSYLFDTDINPRQNNVPKSLRMMLIVLLSEITQHLKDHHTKIRGTVKNQVFLSLPKRHKIRAASSNASSSPRIIPQSDDFYDDSHHLHIRSGRDSEMNRSNRGKLELGMGAVRSIFNRLTSKDRDYPESRDSVTEIEDIKKKASSFRASMTKPDSDLSRVNRNVKWINSVARCLAEEDFTCDHSNGCLFHCAVHLKQSCDSLTDAIKLVAYDTNFKSYEVPVFDREAFLFLNKYETKPTETTLNDINVVSLQFIIDNIVEVSDETLKILINPCWNLLQSRNTRINQQAAVIVILAAQKFQTEMNILIAQKIKQNLPIHEDFEVLWRTRNIMWNMIDRKIARQYKLPSLAVNISLPNPPIGDQIPLVPDAPWAPTFQDIDLIVAEELGTQSCQHVNSRKKEEQIMNIVQKDSQRRENQRKEYAFGAIPVIQSIITSYHKTIEPHDEYDEERRFSSRLMSMSSSGTTAENECGLNQNDDKLSETEGSPEKTTMHSSGRDGIPSQVFPVPLQNIISKFVQQLDDTRVDDDNIQKSVFVTKLIQDCINEDSLLLLRYLTEELIKKNVRQDVSIRQMKKIINIFLKESSNVMNKQSRKIISNYLIGVIMSLIRNADQYESERINQLMMILESVLPHVYGITMKQLKNTLRKEQCEMSIFLTSSSNGIKKITCFGPDEFLIPHQIEITNEAYTFGDLLKEGVDLHRLYPSENKEFYLKDTRLGKLLNPDVLVRDHFLTRKGMTPQVTLVEMEPNLAQKNILAMNIQMISNDISRLSLMLSLLRNAWDAESESFFIKNELIRAANFPRKSIESVDFNTASNELISLDEVKKKVWMEFVTEIFATVDPLSWEDEIIPFLDILSCALINYSDSCMILQTYAVAIIRASLSFPDKFIEYSKNHILDTVVRVYSGQFSNLTTRTTLEFILKQLFQLHRVPFMMELISVCADALVANDKSLAGFVTPKIIHSLICSLANDATFDTIADLAKFINLPAIDSIYECDKSSVTFIESLQLIQMIISGSTNPKCVFKMIGLLHSLTMTDLDRIEDQLSKGNKTVWEDLRLIGDILESLTELTIFDDIHVKNIHMPHFNKTEIGDQDLERGENETVLVSYEEYVERELIQRDYIMECLIRVYKLLKQNQVNLQWSKYLSVDRDVYSSKTHSRIIEISFGILKAPIEVTDEMDRRNNGRGRLKTGQFCQRTKGLNGMQRYFHIMFGHVDWSMQGCRIAIFHLLKKFDRLLQRIIQKQHIRNRVDWESIQAVVDGLNKFFLAHKTFIISSHISSIVSAFIVVLTDDYPPGTRALHEAFIGSNLTAYKSNQLHSPLFLKETIITFLSIVISLRAPDIQLNTVMDLDFFK